MRKLKNDIPAKSRVVVGILLLALLIFGFVKYNDRLQKIVTLQDILDNPQIYNGIFYQTSGKIYHEDQQFIYIRDTESNHLVKILKDSRLASFTSFDPNLDSIMIYGQFIGASNIGFNYFKPRDIRIHRFIIFKYIISIIGLFLFLHIFFKEWKITLTGFKLRSDNYA